MSAEISPRTAAANRARQAAARLRERIRETRKAPALARLAHLDAALDELAEFVDAQASLNDFNLEPGGSGN